jgi:transcriptional regulator with XRE-family HTH domain
MSIAVPPSSEALGRAVRAHRHRLGLSIEALAEAAGMHHTYVSDIELGKGNPSLGKLRDLAGVFEIRVSELLADAEAEDR